MLLLAGNKNLNVNAVFKALKYRPVKTLEHVRAPPRVWSSFLNRFLFQVSFAKESKAVSIAHVRTVLSVLGTSNTKLAVIDGVSLGWSIFGLWLIEGICVSDDDSDHGARARAQGAVRHRRERGARLPLAARLRHGLHPGIPIAY